MPTPIKAQANPTIYLRPPHLCLAFLLCIIVGLTDQIESKSCSISLDSDYSIKPNFLIGNSRSTDLEAFEIIDNVSVERLHKCPDDLIVEFSTSEQSFHIKLAKNKQLISDNYFDIANDINSRQSIDDEFYRNNLFLNLGDIISKNDHCHYHNHPQSGLSAISIMNNHLLSGFFNHGNQTFYLYADVPNRCTILSKSHNLCDAHCTLHNESISKSSVDRSLGGEIRSHEFNLIKKIDSLKSQKRSRRSIESPNSLIRRGPFMSNSSSLYVELLIVHDHGQYNKYKGNTTLITEKTLQIVNIMSSFYRQLNIFVALVGVVIWTESDEIKLTDDGDATLTKFLEYRVEKLLPRFHHDNAQLITDTNFKDGVVGKALRGPICTYKHSGGVNKDHDFSPAVVAVTIAHEMGHNFGMEHDEEDGKQCACPDERCIMSAKSSDAHPKYWSSCSVNYLEESKKQGLLDCLVNRPKQMMGPVCGNGFVEDGEDCDMGEAIPTFGTSKSRKGSNQRCRQGQNCDSTPLNPCCDRRTCKFVGNATCAQGSCCDLTTCTVYNATITRVCRSRQGECDLEEVCDGKSEHCPDDVYYHDGIECGPSAMKALQNPHDPSLAADRNRAYCYQGRCASHNSQCRLLWGPTGKASRDKCFEQNVNGSTSGHCGFHQLNDTYEKCNINDVMCGMLHCFHEQDNQDKKHGKLNYGLESSAILTVSYFSTGVKTFFQCYGAIIDVGPDVRDPGLVPNGASCGLDAMCKDQKCVSVIDVLYDNWCPSGCNGNGICDNQGVCHCLDGTIGSSCYRFFGNNFHLSMLLYMIIFFLPLIALVVYTINHYKDQIKIWWFLHNKRLALRAVYKARQEQTNQSRRMAYKADGNKVSISEPLGLAQQQANSTTARPFYDPFVDPWLDGDNVNYTNKSAGFRLEPLNNPNQVTRFSSSTHQQTVNESCVDSATIPMKPGEF